MQPGQQQVRRTHDHKLIPGSCMIASKLWRKPSMLMTRGPQGVRTMHPAALQFTKPAAVLCCATPQYRVCGAAVDNPSYRLRGLCCNHVLLVHTAGYAVLCCAVLCCAALCCAVLCHAVLCRVALCCAVLCSPPGVTGWVRWTQ
jgi:hypothetical protein